MRSPFEVLQVAPEADEEEINRAYRERVKETHPDQGGSIEEFLLVTAAYEELQSGTSGEWSEGWRAENGTRPERSAKHVEYIDYEVLDDHGWEVDDEALFERAADADLDPADYGELSVEPNETLLEAAERHGFTWPYSCRGGACANCAIYLREGEMEMPVDHILTDGIMERGFRLSCQARPAIDGMQVVYNVKNRPELDDLLLPPGPFERARFDD
ncbi:ferredoxin Fer [Natronorarus salvus]|uniref:ferredoxin Fer n=1 Tax=Natronorarus salvus TaxID=3117733 RepID=UPI002F260EC1